MKNYKKDIVIYYIKFDIKVKGDKILTYQNLKLFKQRGIHDTLEILRTSEQQQISETSFFQQLIDTARYPNSFFRVKKQLLTRQLIAYKLDAENKKVLFLTEKGKYLCQLMQDLDQLLT